MAMTEPTGAIHPGEILREEFLEPLGVTAYRLAKGTGMTESAVGFKSTVPCWKSRR